MKTQMNIAAVAVAQGWSYDMTHDFNLQTFAQTLTAEAGTYGLSNINRSTDVAGSSGGNDLSAEIKVFYDTTLLENATPALYYNQFGQKQPLKSRNGKTVEWRRFKTFEKALTPLKEGVIPDGHKLSVSSITATVQQYGDYVPVSDVLEWAAVDPIIGETTKENGVQAGLTLDTLTRDAIFAGCTNVYYVGGGTSLSAVTAANKLTSADIAKAATILKQQNTPTIDGSFVAIINPSVTYDIRQDSGWIDVHKYSATKEIFNGEVGELHGVRFVETTEAKIVSNGATSGAVKVYHCLFLGKGAYGVVEPTGMSLETILKSKEQVGGPLNQFSTVGWKAMHAAKVLYPERMLDVICGSSFSTTDKVN